MPRASRYLQEGFTYHLTHRCHDQRFLLRFARERKAYREWLRVVAHPQEWRGCGYDELTGQRKRIRIS